MSEAGSEGRGPILWAFLAGAALLTILFYRDFIFDSATLLAGSDMLLEGYPLRKFLVDEVAAGRGVPLWTPHVYGGMPYVALLPGPVFYPTTLLYFLMPLHRAIGWTFVLHTFWGAGFAYFMARSFRLRPGSAVVCGASFMFTGYVTSHLYGGQDGRMFAMTLIPLAFGMLERALRSGDPRWYCGLALAIGLQIFTPHTQIVYFSSLALSLYLIWHLAVRVRTDGDVGSGDAGRGGPSRAPWPSYVRPVLGFGLAFAAAAGLGAIQLLPTFALLGHVTRAATEQGYAFAASWSLPPQEMTALFLPDLIGSLGTYWGQNALKLHTEYMGAAPLALAILALASSFRKTLERQHRRAIWFLVGASVLGVLFAVGAATPIHRIAYRLLPMISSFRAPAMMMAPVAAFVALLAGFGWEAVLTQRGAATEAGGGAEKNSERLSAWPASWLVLGVLAAPILFFGLAAAVDPAALLRFARLSWFEPGWPRLPIGGLQPLLRMGGLVLLAGFGVAWGVGYLVARRWLSPIAVLLVVLVTVSDQWRIDVRYLPVRAAAAEPGVSDDAVLSALRDAAAPGERVWACGRACGWGTYRANRFMYDGVSSATGNQKFLLEPYVRLLGGIRPDDGLLRFPALMPFFEVRYLITGAPMEGLEQMAEEPGRVLYRIPAPPHAYFPAEVRLTSDPDEALVTTRTNRDPLALAVIEAEPGAESPGAGQGVAAIVRYEPELIELDVEAERGGLLAISEIYHPGWRAYVDDVETTVWQTNVAFRGVAVPAGMHRVRLEYRSAAFRTGVWLTLLSALTLVAVFLLGWVRRGDGPGRIGRSRPADA